MTSRPRVTAGSEPLLGGAVAAGRHGVGDPDRERSSRGEAERPREHESAALVDALEPALGVAHGLDGGPPGGRRD